VTGGAGYIGSTTAALLIQAGYDVTVYDNLSRGHKDAVPGEARFVQGDISDTLGLGLLLGDGFDALIHFAALIEAGESMRQPALYFTSNTCASVNLLNAAVEHGVKYVVFSSTAAVYASKDTPLRERDTIKPANVYGQTKRQIEEVLEWYHQIHGLRSCILRYFNASGASAAFDRLRGEDHQPETHLIPAILHTALGKREQFSIYGGDYPTRDGTNVRDYIHIEDLARAHLLALQALSNGTIAQEVYNLGNGRGYSNKEVLETARQITGERIPAVITTRRPGDAATLVASSDKIRRELGWKPSIPELEAILESAWRWHKANPNGYAD
jgi:UDP-glucose 4-epimerase